MNSEPEELPRGRGIYLLPNLFTLSALFAGFYSIVAAMKGVFDNAAIALFIAMILDALDGRIARLTHTQTAFGAELDSLSDMVCFGIAPALILYTWGLGALGKAGWLVSFVYVAAVALRLARFNTQIGKVDKRYFIGLPSPAGAAVVVTLIWNSEQYGVHTPFIHILVAILAALTSFCMVSNFRYHSFKDFDLKNKVPFVMTLLVVVAFVLISVDPPSVLLVLSLGFAMSGPGGWVWRVMRKSKKSSS